jgi:hypothetical protein
MSGDNLHGKQPIKFYSEEVTLSKLIITNKDSRETMKSFHIYLEDKCLFKNLNQEEFDIIWGRIYHSYFKDELTYVECIDYTCMQGRIEEHSY